MLHASCGLGSLTLEDPSPHLAVELTKQATSFGGFLECGSETDVRRNFTAVTSGHLLLLCVELYHRDARTCYVRQSSGVRGQKHGGRAKHFSFSVTPWEF